ncbi:MAG: DUF4112 domain-containing protein [Flammeovirgaceae bacterium]|nr:DUF4112 domain-containing protein [Flammeovirgaceae bacterium]
MDKPTQENKFQEIKWIENITKVMDSSFRFPVLGFKFGLDPILGLIPGIGDFITLCISGLLVISSVKYKISGKLAIMMLGNIFLDFLIGSIPFIGDLFDFAFKANTRNYKLLKGHLEKGKYQGSGKTILLIVVFAFLALLVFCIFISWQIIKFIGNLFE